jgi:hypothetical protein
MGLSTEHDGAMDGYEAVQFPLAPRWPGSRAAVMLRRRSARASSRAVLYPHCAGDSFVPADVASWYTERGFSFYVADLRGRARPGPPADAAPDRDAAPGLSECIGALDAMAGYLRDSASVDTLVVSAHASGALFAALWCDQRRDAGRADALILADPAFGRDGRGSLRTRGRSGPALSPAEAGLAAGMRSPGVLAGAQRRLRRGLDISCPVLVMCTAANSGSQGGGRRGRRIGRRRGHGTTRLGPHVTWLRLEGEPAGSPPPEGAGSGPFFGELGRWLGAYLSGQFRDQLL